MSDLYMQIYNAQLVHAVKMIFDTLLGYTRAGPLVEDVARFSIIQPI